MAKAPRSQKLILKRLTKTLSSKAYRTHFMKGRRSSRRFIRRASRTKGKLDPNVKRVAIKFARLPFGYMLESCQGHFYTKGGKVSLKQIKPNEKLYCDGAYFEISLDESSAAAHEFFAALKAIKKNNPYMEIEPYGGIIYISVDVPSRPVSKQQAEEIQRRTNVMIGAFEKLVDCFVEKYGPKGNAL